MIRRHRDTLSAVFTVSLSSLAYEVLLSRYFSIAQWNHLSFMVLSIAMFGIGAAGVLTGTVRAERFGARIIPAATAAFPLLAAGGYLVVNALPLELFRIPIQPFQSFYLALSFVLFGLPFLAAGMVSSYGYTAYPELSGKVYLWSMLGSAAGAAAPWVLIPLLGVGPSILAVSGIPALALPWIEGKGRILRLTAAAVITAFCVFAISLDLPGAAVNVSSYKGLPQLMSVPGSAVISASSSMRGEVTAVRSGSVRYAPGASLKSRTAIPPQDGLFVDAHSYGAVTAEGAGADFAYAAETLDYAPYAANPNAESILVIQEGGGHAMAAAIASGGPPPVLVISQPAIAEIARDRYGGLGVTVTETTPRAYIAGGGSKYDIVHLDVPSGPLPGLEALNQNHVLTVEAFLGYLGRCSADGVIAIGRGLLLPPSDLLKTTATVIRALEETGAAEPGSHIAVIRTFDRYCLIVSPSPLGIETTAALSAFTREYNFDLVHYPGMDIGEANRYNVFPEPYYALEMERLLSAVGDGSREYHRQSIVDVRPNTDAIPYFTRYVKWTRLPALVAMTGGRGYTYLLSGEVLVWVVFAVALACVTAVMIVPASIAARGRPRTPAWTILIFVFLGAGYMLLQIGLIKMTTLVTGSPSVAFALVLPVMLMGSGLGGYFSDRLKRGTAARIAIGIFVLAAALAAGMGRAAPVLLAASPVPRYLGIVILTAAVSIPMGIPFPAAMRETPGARGRSTAWAANGSASVLASILAVPAAMQLGIPRLFALAALAYLGVYVAGREVKTKG